MADTEREFGNYLFRQKHFMDARERYKRVSCWERVSGIEVGTKPALQSFSHMCSSHLFAQSLALSSHSHMQHQGLPLCVLRSKRHGYLYTGQCLS